MNIKVRIRWRDDSEQALMKLAAFSGVAHAVGLIVFSALPRFIGPPPMPRTTIAEIVSASSLFPASEPAAPQAQGPTPSQRAEAARKALEEARQVPAPPKPPDRKPAPRKPAAQKPPARPEKEIPPIEPGDHPQGGEEAGQGPLQAPRPAAAPPGDSGGISFGSGALGGIPSIGSSAFPYDYYRSSLVAILQSNWRRPVDPGGISETFSCRIQFTILKSGIVQDPRIASASGNAALDQSALRAVYDSNPLPPLPFQYGHGSVSAEVVFDLTPE